MDPGMNGISTRKILPLILSRTVMNAGCSPLCRIPLAFSNVNVLGVLGALGMRIVPGVLGVLNKLGVLCVLGLMGVLNVLEVFGALTVIGVLIVLGLQGDVLEMSDFLLMCF
jgi:hypothetical protein